MGELVSASPGSILALSACDLSNPVSAAREACSLNALNNITNPCVSYTFTTYMQ